jgi:hypothetical protein
MDQLGWIICTIVLVVIIVAILVANRRAADARAQALKDAHTAYQKALTKLREKPADAFYRQQALDAGRAYSSLTREGKGVTIFDEVALSNDINAAAAGAAVASVKASAPAPPSSIQERLKRLDDLKANGAITDQEYAARRQSILGEL